MQIAMEPGTLSFLLLSLFINFLPSWAEQGVFLQPLHTSAVFLRSKRANSFFFEEFLQGNLERECKEELCSKEEAREIFENDQATEDFWSLYYDGDQCKPNPCQHGGTCKDKAGGYICTCSEFFSGLNCERDVSQCPTEGPYACEHFCRPMYDSYRCFCTDGYSLHSDGRRCIPQGKNPCGKLMAASHKSRQKEGKNMSSHDICPGGHCPWQVRFEDVAGELRCFGVLLGQRSVLTTASCLSSREHLNMIIGSIRIMNISSAADWVQHKRYSSGDPGDDLAFLRLREPTLLGPDSVPLCLPEKDFSENVLMQSGREGILEGGPTRHSYLSLEDCRANLKFNITLTNKMFCMMSQGGESTVRSERRKSTCDMKLGRPVATVEGETAFLTGVLLTPDCSESLVFTKLSRYLHWVRQHLEQAEEPPHNPREDHR